MKTDNFCTWYASSASAGGGNAERGALYIFGGESANGMVHNTMLVLDVSDALGIEPLADDAEEEEEEEEEVEADRER